MASDLNMCCFIGRIISLTGVPRSKVRAILRKNGFLKQLKKLGEK
jgi:hypothetical protein